jgi:HAD superfamily hydrolase (TIGR01509 family)
VTTGDELRSLMRRAPGSVAVLTVDTGSDRLGLTVSSLVSLSLEPPLVGVSIGRETAMHELLREAGGFAASLLAGGQEWLAQHFARGVPPIGMWSGIATEEGARGAPLLVGALGWLECRLGRVGAARHRYSAARPPRGRLPHAVIGAVVFDLDGVILQTEEVWDEVRGHYVVEQGGSYDAEAQRAMMGMSAPEWSRYLSEELGVPGTPEEISADIVRLMEERYREELPLIPGAYEAVERLAACWPLGLASSSNRPLIDAGLELSGLAGFFRSTVSSEEVARGKPAPDVYLEAARRLGVEAERCAAVEDSHAGIRSSKAARMHAIAIPNPSFPPGGDALALADVVLPSIADLTAAVVESLDQP